MSKKSRRGSEEKFNNSEQLQDNLGYDSIFDFPCINDYCSGKNGTRAMGIAWKGKRSYKSFCYHCGYENDLTKEEFKASSDKLKQEKNLYNAQKQKELLEQKKKLEEDFQPPEELQKTIFKDNYPLDYESFNDPETDFEETE